MFLPYSVKSINKVINDISAVLKKNEKSIFIQRSGFLNALCKTFFSIKLKINERSGGKNPIKLASNTIVKKITKNVFAFLFFKENELSIVVHSINFLFFVQMQIVRIVRMQIVRPNASSC